MTVIALVGNKGGAGKTTLAVNLATALKKTARTAIIDADPQRSSTHWRAISEDPGIITVLDDEGGLNGVVRRASEEFEHLVIDCPPSVNSVQTREALRTSRIALIPLQPSPLDIWASVHMEQEIARARDENSALAALLVINQLEPRTRLSQMTREALGELEIPVANTAIRRRMVYRTSVLEGRTVFDVGSRGMEAAEEVLQLIGEVLIV
jgi:chromosome partitioning protein